MSDVRVERATVQTFEEIRPLFDQFRINNPHVAPERWRRLFHYTWPMDDETRGYILRDADRIVGVVGTLLSDREIAGRRERFCNLTSWFVLPEYRAYSLELRTAAASHPDATIISFTPLASLARFHQMMGFRPLESQLRILFPWPDPRGIGAALRFRVTTDPRKIPALLNEQDRMIWRDHQAHPCRHLVVHDRSGRYCYVVSTRTKGRRYFFSHVHYLSDAGVFVEALERVRPALCLQNRAMLTMIEQRFLAGRHVPQSKIAEMPTPRIFFSSTLAAGQIDNLYSELVVLGL